MYLTPGIFSCSPGDAWLCWLGQLESHMTNIRGVVFSYLQPPGHCTESALKHTPSLSVKEPYFAYPKTLT